MKKLDEGKKKVKLDVLKSLKDEMMKMMGDDVKGFKKVTVAAPDKEGLKRGLEKAEELVEAKEAPEAEEASEVCSHCGK